MTAQPAKCLERRTIAVPTSCLEQPVEKHYPRLRQEVLDWLKAQGITDWSVVAAFDGQGALLSGSCEDVTTFQMTWG